MKIEIINKLNGRRAIFYDLPEWNNNGHPICAIMPHNYSDYVFDNQEKDCVHYILNNYSGFFDNNKISSWLKNGIGENGQVFKTNNFDNMLIQWNFIPAFKGTKEKISSANFLNSVLMSKNTPLTVNVYTSNNIFSQDFYVGEETSTENGAIQMISAYDGDGIYWHDEKPTIVTATKYVNDNNEDSYPYIVKDLPYIPLWKHENQNLDGNQLRLVVEVANETSIIKIKLGCDGSSWNRIILENKLNKEKTTITNKYSDRYLILEPQAKKVYNESGTSRLDCLSGVFPTLDSGRNEFIITIDDGANKDIPDDFISSITYNNNYTAIF